MTSQKERRFNAIFARNFHKIHYFFMKYWYFSELSCDKKNLKWIFISYGIHETRCVFYIPSPKARGYKTHNSFHKREWRGPRVNFVMREALFEIYTWIFCLSYLHEKQTSKIQSLYLHFIKIVPFWLWTICFEIHNRVVFRTAAGAAGSYGTLVGKMDVKIFLMLIVAENTGSVNIVHFISILI